MTVNTKPLKGSEMSQGGPDRLTLPLDHVLGNICLKSSIQWTTFNEQPVQMYKTTRFNQLQLAVCITAQYDAV